MADPARPTLIAPPLRWVAAAAAVVYAVAAIVAILSRIDTILFLIFLAVLLASILHVPVDRLARHMPRALATVLTLLAALGTLTGLIVLAAPTAEEQARRLAEQAPQALDTLERWFREAPQLEAEARALLSRVVPLAFGVLSAVGGVVVLLVLAAFLALSPHTYVRGALKLVPRRHEAVGRELIGRCAVAIRSWITATVILMFAVAAMTAVGLLLLGIETWLVLSLIMFFTEFIPYVGPVLGAIPALAVALAESPTKALWVLGLYVLIQQLENHLLQPLVMRREAEIHPALLIVWQLLCGAAFGFAALLVATPLLACLQAAVRYLWIERALGKSAGPT